MNDRRHLLRAACLAAQIVILTATVALLIYLTWSTP